MTSFLLHPASLLWILHWSLVLGLSVRVIMKRPSTGVAMAWILLIALAPFFGALVYLLIGERRIGFQRTRRLRFLRGEYRELAADAMQSGTRDIAWEQLPACAAGMDHLGDRLANCPSTRGSQLQLFSETEAMLKAIANDIDAAEKSVLMEFYIWQAGGVADEVLEAVIRASKRGVFCCVLIDALGARPWWKSDQPRRLREAGVHLKEALPVGIVRTFVGRTDLRLHRKIVVVDGRNAWTGSMNLVDPRYFKQDSGVGQWVDAMVRVEGCAVANLAATMLGDWILESGQSVEALIEQAKLEAVAPTGDTVMQVLPSGPGEFGDTLLQMVLATINSAQATLTMTTPYLVPDESLLRAIRGAASRGVKVQLIVPEKVDSLLTRYASRSYFVDLLECGVEVYLYRRGLLHTKSIIADQSVAMFGTVNLDMRSLWLNYELALFVYDASFATQLFELQQTYVANSDRLDPDTWSQRSVKERFLENTFRLASPLL